MTAGAEQGESPLRPEHFWRHDNAPDAEFYVSEGDAIEAGATIGLVEIMKNFYEVQSDAAGTVVRFLVENEALVDAGQDILVLEQP